MQRLSTTWSLEQTDLTNIDSVDHNYPIITRL